MKSGTMNVVSGIEPPMVAFSRPQLMTTTIADGQLVRTLRRQFQASPDASLKTFLASCKSFLTKQELRFPKGQFIQLPLAREIPTIHEDFPMLGSEAESSMNARELAECAATIGESVAGGDASNIARRSKLSAVYGSSMRPQRAPTSGVSIAGRSAGKRVGTDQRLPGNAIQRQSKIPGVSEMDLRAAHTKSPQGRVTTSGTRSPVKTNATHSATKASPAKSGASSVSSTSRAVPRLVQARSPKIQAQPDESATMNDISPISDFSDRLSDSRLNDSRLSASRYAPSNAADIERLIEETQQFLSQENVVRGINDTPTSQSQSDISQSINTRDPSKRKPAFQTKEALESLRMSVPDELLRDLEDLRRETAESLFNGNGNDKGASQFDRVARKYDPALRMDIPLDFLTAEEESLWSKIRVQLNDMRDELRSISADNSSSHAAPAQDESQLSWID